MIAKADDPWITPSERTGLTDTPSYDETVNYLTKLAAASPLLSLQEFGRSAQGRILYVVVASRDRPFGPAALLAAGKPTLLAQGGIHAGEIDGKDAGLMFLRDLTVGGKTGLLDHANFLFVPIFNADGHERISEWNRPNQRGPVHQGWRTTAQNLNLNRDYMKADTPEMLAMLRLIEQWSPALYLDLHVTDGMDYQYDITFGYNGDTGSPAWSPHIAAWLNSRYRPAAESALKAAGHIPGPLIEAVDPRDPGKGFSLGPFAARFSNGYGDLRHLPSVLVENHSLKSYRQRVLGTYVLLEACLRLLGAEAAALRQAIVADQSARPASFPINWRDEPKATNGGPALVREFLGIASESYRSPATGEMEVRWLGLPKTYARAPVFPAIPMAHLTRPQCYWVPATKPEVIARLLRHGIRCETLAAPQRETLEMYRLIDPRPRPGEKFHPYEGRHPLKTGVHAETRTEVFPAGSVRVPTDQPLGDLAMALLEPESEDSLFAWGFFLEVLQRTEYIEGYVLAPWAEQRLATDAPLKAEFEAMLAADARFAGDPEARLQWFYQRSKFYDERYLLYPVGIER